MMMMMMMIRIIMLMIKKILPNPMFVVLKCMNREQAIKKNQNWSREEIVEQRQSIIFAKLSNVNTNVSEKTEGRIITEMFNAFNIGQQKSVTNVFKNGMIPAALP